MSEAIRLQGVSRTVTDTDSEPATATTILEDVSVTVARGGLLHVVGPSGAGKSSFLRLINRLDERSSGEIEVLGRPIDSWQVAHLRRRVGMVFQTPSLLGRSARANLSLPDRFCSRQDGADQLEARITQSLELAGVEADVLDRNASKLSVGQQQRICLARTMMTRPAILLLDEATASLDPNTAKSLLRRIINLKDKKGLTVISATHRLEEVSWCGGQLLILVDGRIAGHGTVEELMQSPPNETVETFLKGDDQ